MAALPCPPGTRRPRRFRPRFHWELLACGVSGHELIGTGAAKLRLEDEVYAREGGAGFRWYRCVRCDSWLPLPVPERPRLSVPPPREQIELPLRGKALRDRVVLRLIAIDRAVHFVVLSLLAVSFMGWDYLHDPLSGITWRPEGGGGILFGSRSFDMFLLNILILLSGLVIYLVARWIQRRRGVNLDAAYGEIPVE